MSANATPARQMPRLPSKTKVDSPSTRPVTQYSPALSATNRTQVRHPSQPDAISAAAAPQNAEGGCHPLPRLSCETKVDVTKSMMDVTKCYTSHAKCRWRLRAQQLPLSLFQIWCVTKNCAVVREIWWVLMLCVQGKWVVKWCVKNCVWHIVLNMAKIVFEKMVWKIVWQWCCEIDRRRQKLCVKDGSQKTYVTKVTKTKG